MSIRQNYVYVLLLSFAVVLAVHGWLINHKDLFAIGFATTILAAQLWFAVFLFQKQGIIGFIGGLVLFKATLFTGIWLFQ